MDARRIPWATALVVALALLVWCLPDGAEALAYDRAAILHGEVWRLWSGHLVHFSGSHLCWDLLATALAGAWIERAGFRGGRWLWVITPPLVSLLMLLGEPTLARYGGLSAMATACVVFACLGELRQPNANRAVWWTILTLVALKVGWEFYTGATIFARFDGATVRAIPLSHAAGAGAAVVVSLIFNRPERTKILSD
jgi:rhomboid family GlyGly-CTERM serine protease